MCDETITTELSLYKLCWQLQVCKRLLCCYSNKMVFKLTVYFKLETASAANSWALIVRLMQLTLFTYSCPTHQFSQAVN